MVSLILRLFGLIYRLSWKHLVQHQFLLIIREQLQIFDNQNSVLQIIKLNSLYMRLCRNSFDVSSILRVMTLLFAISHLWNSISIFIISSSYTSISNLTWNIVCSVIQAEFSRWTNTTDITYYSSIQYRNKPF